MSRLRITEIFYSLQGETRTVGIPTVFVRLTGCPLRCTYCDTAYAFTGGQWTTLESVLATIRQYKTHYVTVTGGEPLAQRACVKLLHLLCEAGYEVSLETSGALDISQVDARVVKVLDVKTPYSAEMDKNRWENLAYLSPRDQIKIVIGDENDYGWAKEVLIEKQLASYGEVIFSPVYGALSPTVLAEWILRDQLPVRMQIQLHKLLWGETKGR